MNPTVRALLFWGSMAAVAGVTYLLTTGRPGPASPPRHVLLFTLDTTRADALGAYGASEARTHHLDALAARGVRFDDAVTPSPITGPAHAALFTGQYPARHGVRDNATTPLPDAALTLAERLRDSGFTTGGFIGAFVLDRAFGFAQGFSAFGGFTKVESGREANAERPGDQVVDQALTWLRTVPLDDRVFLWVHLYDPHAPYRAPEPFGRDFDGREYAGEVAFADHQIGRVLDAWRERGALDETLVVAIADHGESLGQHGEDEHGVFLYEPVLRVPFIAAGPGIRSGHVATEQVRAIDLVPTIADMVGVAVAETLDGETLRPLLEGRRRSHVPTAYAESYYPKLHYGWSELRALRADGWKVIDAPRPELYAVTRDAAETSNLFDGQRALGARMIDEARALERTLTGGRPLAAATPDADTLERLRSLGYVGTSSPTLPDADRGPDPKDRIEERRTFKRLMTAALDDLAAGRLDEAARGLQALVRLNTRAYDLHQMLGEVHQRQRRPREALREFDLAARINPSAPGPWLSAAELLLTLGRTAEARARLDKAAALAPESFDVALVEGLVLEAERKPAEAAGAYRRAITANPANPRARLNLVRVASQLKDYQSAADQLRALIAAGHLPSRMYFALGQLAELQGRRDEALGHYRDALRLEPGLPMAQRALQAIEKGTPRHR